MFKSDELIYIQMQKTACTHIAKLLAQLFKGEIIGKHNVATPEQIKSHPYFIGSIRNPWDWYLSLWTFGVSGRGALMYHLTKRNLLPTFKTMLKHPKTGYQPWLNALTKDVKTWRSVYSHSDDITAFRRWIALIHSSNNCNTLGQDNRYQNISQYVGLMTYRYLLLYCYDNQQLTVMNFSQFKQLYQFEQDTCYIDYFVRQEALETTLSHAIEHIRPLTTKEKSFIINAKKANTSIRMLSINEYYDQKSIDLIQNRDRLIIEKFNYSPLE